MNTAEQQADVIDPSTGEVLSEAIPMSKSLAIRPTNTSLVPHSQRGLTISTFEDAERMAVKLADSSLVPTSFRGKPADVFLALNMGLELGLSPIASLRAVHVIEGRPGLASDAMIGVVLASGAARYFRCTESTQECATYETLRAGDSKPRSLSFTLEEAKTAGLLGKDNWKKYPRRMMEARAKSALCRDVYPDVLHGVFCVEELEDIDHPPANDEPHEPAKPTPPPVEPNLTDRVKELGHQLVDCRDEAEMKKVAAAAGAEHFDEGEKAALKPIWRQHVGSLKRSAKGAKA